MGEGWLGMNDVASVVEGSGFDIVALSIETSMGSAGFAECIQK